MSTVQKTRMPILLEFSTFYSKVPVEAPVFIRNKLYPDDPNNKLFPLVLYCIVCIFFWFGKSLALQIVV